SGFAALAVAVDRALGLGMDARELSLLARRGSGSGARSIFGGFVEMAAGTRDDGEDAFAKPLLEPAAWPLKVVVAITSHKKRRPIRAPAWKRRSAPHPTTATGPQWCRAIWTRHAVPCKHAISKNSRASARRVVSPCMP